MNIQYAAISEIGCVRKVNQDAVYVDCADQWGLFVVADGMGGHSEGERASREIVDCFKKWADEKREVLGDYSTAQLMDEMHDALAAANDKIFNDTPTGQLCGSTVVALFVRKENYLILSAGDSRCYSVKKRLSGIEMSQLTHDEVMTLPGKNNGRLTNAVGIQIPLRYSIVSRRLPANQLFFLCTDGVYKYCSDKVLQEIFDKCIKVNAGEGLDEISRYLYEDRGRDNFSAIFVSVN